MPLAKETGGAVAEALPWKDYKEAAASVSRGCSTCPRARPWPPTPTPSPRGWRTRPAGGRRAEIFDDWDNAFHTPSKKFEFYSQLMAARLEKAFPDPAELEKHLVASGVATRGDDLVMPHWEPPQQAGTPAEFPFLLMPYRAINYAEGGVRHLRRLVELPLCWGNAWLERVELSPVDARQLGALRRPEGAGGVGGRQARALRPPQPRHPPRHRRAGAGPRGVAAAGGSEQTGGYALLPTRAIRSPGSSRCRAPASASPRPEPLHPVLTDRRTS